MTKCLVGGRGYRAAAIGLLCACVAMGPARYALSEVIVTGRLDGIGDAMQEGAVNPGADGRDMSSSSDCPGDAGCCERGCVGWFGAEYLLWQLDGNRLGPLVTAGPASESRSQVAHLGDPNTVVLFGGDSDNDWRSGYRLFGGLWLDCGQTCGIGGDYFNIGDGGGRFVSPQDSTLVVGRPFLNKQTNQQDLQLISVPNELDGRASVASSDNLQGAGLTLNRSLWRCCACGCSGASSEVILVSGYRYYQYGSNLSVGEDLTVLPGTTTPLVPGTTFALEDNFRTQNEFNGGEIGFEAHAARDWWWLDGLAKVALGAQHRVVTIDGQTTIDVPGGGEFSARGGLLTSEATNIGRFDDTIFAVVPEFRLGVGAYVTRSISVHAGYNLLIWGDVARAASHISPGLAVDPRNLPPVQLGGGPEPAFPGIRGSELLAHGLDVSVVCQW